MIPKVIITRPKLVLEVKCPKCSYFQIVGTPYVDVSCKNCHTKFNTKADIDLYYSISKKIEQLLANNNEIHIVGERDNSQVHSNADELKPRTFMEYKIYNCLLAIKDTKVKQKCWEVSEIENSMDLEYHTTCKECGYCNSCVQCKSCQHIYTPKKVKDENRYTCPECGSKKYQDTPFRDLKKKECPHCKSKNIRFTSFTSDKRQCPRCNTLKINKPKAIPIYRLKLERQKRFYLDG